MAEAQLAHPAGVADDDDQLARKIQAGDRHAFELLMRRYNRRLYRLARAVLHDRTDAEDALQEAYLDAYRSIGSFRQESALGTWLSRLVLNECLGRQRRNIRRQSLIPMSNEDPTEAMRRSRAPESGRPDEQAAAAQLRGLLESRLQQLPDGFRLVFVLRSVEELTVEETAECLDIPPETVRSRHFRAKALLREALARDIDAAERGLFEFGGPSCDRLVRAVMQRLDSQAL